MSSSAPDGAARVVAFAPFPPPATGQSVATALFVDALAEHVPVERIDTADRRVVWREPWALSAARVRAYARRIRALRGCAAGRIVYMTPAGSPLGLARDVPTLLAAAGADRIVAHVHSGEYPRLLRHPVLGPLARWAASRFDRVIVPSQRLMAQLVRAVPGLPVVVIRNTVEPTFAFAEGEVERKWAARPTAEPRVLFLSHMLPGKGFDALADAAATLARRGVGFQLTFAGSWPRVGARAAFEARLAGLGLAERTDVLGPVSREDARALLLASDVLALPTTYASEVLPIAVLEGIAAGCAIVATQHAGIPEAVRDGVEGRLVAPNDPAALADALADALAGADGYGRAARQRFLEAFEPGRVTAAFVRAVLEPTTPALSSTQLATTARE